MEGFSSRSFWITRSSHLRYPAYLGPHRAPGRQPPPGPPRHPPARDLAGRCPIRHTGAHSQARSDSAPQSSRSGGMARKGYQEIKRKDGARRIWARASFIWGATPTRAKQARALRPYQQR